MAVFCSRNIAIKRPVTLLLTGKGDKAYAYATIKGQKQHPNNNQISINILSGESVIFMVKGSDSLLYVGKIIIDGETVLKSTNGNAASYEWIVPSNISSATITFSYSGSGSSSSYKGEISITTTQEAN